MPLTWVVIGLAVVGLFFVWQGGPALILEGQKISQQEFSKFYENLVGRDFSKLGPGGIEYRLELQSRIIDELLRKRLIAREVERRRIVIPKADIDDQTEIAFERILKQNNLTEEQAEQILKQQGRTLESFKRELRQAVELNMQTERLRDAVVGPIEPTDQELAAYLEEHRDKYDTPELAQIRDRVLKDYIEAERARRFHDFYAALKARAKIFIADPVLRIFYLYEYAGRLEEAQREYAALKDPNQKLHLARVLRKKLEALGPEAAPELVLALKEEILQLWLAQIAAWPSRADRSYGVSQMLALKPNELPGQALFQITVSTGALDETIRVLQRRLKEYGVHESVVLAGGDEQIIVWARTETPNALARLVSVQGKLELKRVLREGAVGERLQATGLGEQALKDRAEAEKPGSGRFYIVTEAPLIDSPKIAEISVRSPIVRIRLSARTAQNLAKALGQVDQTLAIVIDSIVYGTVVMGRSLRELLAQPGSVFDMQVEVSSGEEAQALALALRVPLPTAVRVARPGDVSAESRL